MEKLPIEMLSYLFGFLNPKQRTKSVAPVCSLWRTICQETHFWKRLTLRNSYLKSRKSHYPAYRRLLKQHADHLQTLCLKGIFSDPMSILGNRSFVQLKTIYITCLTDTLVKALVMTCPFVEDIKLNNYNLDIDLHALTRVCQWSSLKRISIHCEVTSTADPFLLMFAEACTDLEQVYLYFGPSTHMNDDSILKLVQLHHRTLTHLALPSWTITSMSPLTLCRQLRHLELHFREEISGEDLVTLGRSPNLTHLSLRICKLMPLALPVLFRACSTLTHVKLTNIQMTSAVMHHLTTSCPQLQYVWIESWCIITGDMLMPLLEAKKLRSMALWRCENLENNVIHQIALKLPQLQNVLLGSPLDEVLQKMPHLNRHQLPYPWFD